MGGMVQIFIVWCLVLSGRSTKIRRAVDKKYCQHCPRSWTKEVMDMTTTRLMNLVTLILHITVTFYVDR